MDGYLLSDKDVAKIVALVNAHMARRINTVGRVGELRVDIQEILAPEVYVAQTPPDGIPGLIPTCGTGTGSCFIDPYEIYDLPGYADCMIRRIMGEEESDPLEGLPSLVTTPIESKRVYNLSEDAIPGNAQIVAIRDKYGHYIGIPITIDTNSSSPDNGGDTTDCSGCGWLEALRDSDCVAVSVQSAAGACGCGDSDDIVYLTTTDGQTWGAPTGGEDLSNTCCPDDMTPATLHGTTPTGRTVTITNPGPGFVWYGVDSDNQTIELWCDDGTWQFSDGSQGLPPVGPTSLTCAPFAAEFTHGTSDWTITA